MKTAEFDFQLPDELIAPRPLPQRDASRMLLVDGRVWDNARLPPVGGERSHSDRGGAASFQSAFLPHKRRCSARAQSFAKNLRRNMTKHECILWKHLRKSPDGFDFIKQLPIGKYVADFVNRRTKLILELDGSGHGEEKQIYHDAERDKFLQDSGYRIIRFWNESVIKNIDGVLGAIHHYLLNEKEIPPLQNFYPKRIIEYSGKQPPLARPGPQSGQRRGAPPPWGGDAPIPEIKDCYVSDFTKFICPSDVVVFNDSRVIPARFDASDVRGGIHEITLHTNISPKIWIGLCKKFTKFKVDDELKLNDGTKIRVIGIDSENGIKIQFDCDDVFAVLERVGKIPLPPYMKRSAETADRERYQTVYARSLGSMAAPTAGLHFTPELLEKIRAVGAQTVNITLHVGAGTWMPVKSDDIAEHRMHGEWGCITAQQAEIINRAKSDGGRVIAIGTTSLRLLESAATGPGKINSFCGDTDIFITPGYEFKIVDVLLTNFHLPRSTLFMLVSAFAGLSEMRAAYRHAIMQKYRFYSYGDCCLLFKK